jgi:CPA1 family monovalent cation:H+ antiporter
MRGVVSLALALPLSLGFEVDVDVRRTIIFLTLVVIVVTLLVQGATLLPLVERLKVGNSEREQREERAARLHARRAGMAAVKAAGKVTEKAGSPSQSEGDELGARLASGSVGIARPGTLGRHVDHLPALLRALDAQRQVVDNLRDAGRMSGALAERLDTELDLDAMNAVGEGARLTDAGET